MMEVDVGSVASSAFRVFWGMGRMPYAAASSADF